MRISDWSSDVCSSDLSQASAREKAKPASARPSSAGAETDERIYVMTPQARVIELPAGATPVDFAYYLHTDLGHRCRGARVDGQMVPLLTRLSTGQTVESIAAKSAGPSTEEGRGGKEGVRPCRTG